MSGCQFTNPGEIWKAISDFPGYEVSNHGRVRSFLKRIHPKGLFGFGCIIVSNVPQLILKPSIDHHGYRRVLLHHKKHNKIFRIARLVLSTFIGPCPDGMQACHNDGHNDNDFLCNLRWDTPINNHNDKFIHGTAIRGKNYYKTTNVISDSNVKILKFLFENGFTILILSLLFCIKKDLVRKIVHGK